MKESNKAVISALRGVHDEFERINTENSKKMVIIVYQILNFSEMDERNKNLVLYSLFKEMNKFGWKDWAEELKLRTEEEI